MFFTKFKCTYVYYNMYTCEEFLMEIFKKSFNTIGFLMINLKLLKDILKHLFDVQLNDSLCSYFL